MKMNRLKVICLLMVLGVSSAFAQNIVNDQVINQVVQKIAKERGVVDQARLQKGVKQCATIWNTKDGSVEYFTQFCAENYISDDKELDVVFGKIQDNFEILFGNFNKISVDLKLPLHLDKGKVLPVDEIFGGYDVSAHFNDDMFANRVAFIVLLNFPYYTLQEKTNLGMSWTNRQWAYARLGDMFITRIPAELNQKISEVTTYADTYISDYNVYMGNLVDQKNKTLFDKNLKLITHWGLRDELKSNYAGKAGIEKQKMIYQVMLGIINQTIPAEVINNSELTWNPYLNKVYKDGKEVAFKSEPNMRYQHMLNIFRAIKAVDAHSPFYNTYIKRKFEQEMEIPQEEVEKLFISYVSSPQVKKVASLISKRLGRKLEPFDIWYDGFKARSNVSEKMLDSITKAKYPNKLALARNLAKILTTLDFKLGKANYIVSKITVDASRGAGHAWGAMMKGDKARLRTRIGADGMNYKGYNIAVHEFGHNVEQTLSLYDVENYLMNGVPNTAFTEALAFIFQKRDLELLGIKNDNPQKEYLLTLDNFWATYEIMGVSLVDMNVWKWLYEHPEATPEQLKIAVVSIAKDVWNKYYAPVIGVKDSPILAIYSHMIDSPLYLSAYPLGHLIDFQIEKQIKGKNFGDEVIRMYTQGRMVPQVWMKKAVGMELSAQPILESVEDALKVVRK